MVPEGSEDTPEGSEDRLVEGRVPGGCMKCKVDMGGVRLVEGKR